MPHSAPRPELTPSASGAESAGGGRVRGVGPVTDLHMVRDGGVRVEEDARDEQVPLQGKPFVFSGAGLSNFKSFWLSL